MILQYLFLVKGGRRISQSEIRNSTAAEKSESESEGGQKFLPRRVARSDSFGAFPPTQYERINLNIAL